MANIPENLRYSKDHEWVLVDGDTASIGITDYAQSSLGDVVYIDLPASATSSAFTKPSVRSNPSKRCQRYLRPCRARWSK